MSPSACQCPVCGDTKPKIILAERANIPPLQNVTVRNRADAMNFPTVELRMLWCGTCSFVWNSRFDVNNISYDAGYNNDVSASGYYQKHLEAIADRVIAAIPDDEPIHYVEVGCGEGDFLNLVIERAGGRCVSATGFDPSFTGDAKLNPMTTLHRRYFSKDMMDLIPAEANIICSRHTIEHVPEPHGFVTGLAAAMTAPHRRLFLETPSVDWILETVTFQDFFYEHCSIYNPRSMAHLLAQHRLWCRVEPVYDGQYMWIEAGKDTAAELPQESVEPALAQDFVRKCDEKIAHNGPFAVWGAASKGLTFSLIMAEVMNNRNAITCAIDLNPAKQGCFLPVTGVPILSPEAASEQGIKSVVIMNPNYRLEIEAMIARMDWSPDIYSFD